MNQQINLFDHAEEDSHESLTLATYAENAYLDYAISVVKGRALPDLCDGQKSVQRRILYSMYQLNLSHETKPKKSAAVVGDVLGKLHPHGDQSVYDAMVRMAQEFTMRYPLIDGHGNFGSRDGDGAAAMRYTEVRLNPISDLILQDIEMNTIDLKSNYDDSFKEPKILPARLPFLLLNGASGIAVGMATEIPPHNLGEIANASIAFIKNQKITNEELFSIIPGPDFPGGGQIISPPNIISDIYKTGRGSLKIRARWKIEELARGQWQIAVIELPPGISSQKILEEIEELSNPKIKSGKKSLSSDQISSKQSILSSLESIRDESGREFSVRLIIEPKSKNQNKKEFINQLLTATSLESSFSINLVTIGIDGKPRSKNLLEIIKEWTSFRFDILKRKLNFNLVKLKKRIHLLEGREKILLNIEQIINLLRESDNPKNDLINIFKLSDLQSEDILNLRLRQIAKLEELKLKNELKNLRKEKKEINEILKNQSSLKKFLIKEISEDSKKFGDERRTIIKESEKAFFEQKKINEPITIIISKKGWIRSKNGHGYEKNNFNFKTGDSIYELYECMTNDYVLAFGTNGRVYSMPISKLPISRGDGTPITSFFDIENNSRLTQFFAGSPDNSFLITSTAGLGFSSKISNLISKQKSGKTFIFLVEKSELLKPSIINNDSSAVACLSEEGRLLIFGLNEVKHLSNGGRGIKFIELNLDEKMISACAITKKGITLKGSKGKLNKFFEMNLSASELSKFFGKRGRKGKIVSRKISPKDVSKI